MNESNLGMSLAAIVGELRTRGRRFALVGGLAVSIRGEVRFTRDVDLAVVVASDADIEELVRDLGVAGYRVVTIVEHDTQMRLATVRLQGSSGVVVDLLVASSGVEEEVVSRATPVPLEGVGPIPVARAVELLALKVLSMTERRPQDRMDAEALLGANPELDLSVARDLLSLIMTRGYGRGQDLLAKLDALLADLADGGRNR